MIPAVGRAISRSQLKSFAASGETSPAFVSSPSLIELRVGGLQGGVSRCCGHRRGCRLLP